MAGRESAEDKIARIVGKLLDDRERKAREASDPKARFENVMGRLEAFLDGQDSKGGGQRRRPRDDGEGEDDDDGEGGGDIVSQLFGGGRR